ncbi:hypothetical protein J6590_013172 [Homalodisca vitripennis]|nr:hypothetical protein J6590_013172 [Homalodisca vitripennis]
MIGDSITELRRIFHRADTSVCQRPACVGYNVSMIGDSITELRRIFHCADTSVCQRPVCVGYNVSMIGDSITELRRIFHCADISVCQRPACVGYNVLFETGAIGIEMDVTRRCLSFLCVRDNILRGLQFRSRHSSCGNESLAVLTVL